MLNKENAKQQIAGLLEKYRRVVEEKRIDKYNEEMTKKDFILPLFRALGWNVEDSVEVTAEERISKDRVDYGFRIGGIPKFFLEAKSLKADLDDPKFAEQAINYAWHKGCTWAVLTDFESVKIFNAEWKATDLFQSHLKTMPCQEFSDRFEELWLLSKEGFEQGLLDKEAEDWGKKTKKTPVGEQLLSDLTKWRTELSKDILQRNKDIKEGDLDEAVQRIIDRLIFIRNCEDRELEQPRLLSSTVREWDSKRRGSLAENIVVVFKHFDDEYNSKLFQHHLCDDLDVSNQVLAGIIEELYHTKDRTIEYDFSAIDADVLGNVYEQYLGHILKKTAKRAIVEKKHAYRKEQGIYYTPTYIVDYIVRNTLGELLRDKKVDVEKIRVLDPACGSGSFLKKAFDVLNEFYSKSKDYQTQLDIKTGLPFTKKVKILQNNVFGVDLDTKAVEIAQLNLLLKIAEKRQRLPLLQENIKCGNSLIDDEKVAGDKAFKWEEKFQQIMDEGGFDVVIGNPPWVQSKFLPEKDKEYYVKKYEVARKQYDLFTLFIENSLNLLKDGSMLGFIVPDRFITNLDYEPFRKYLLGNCCIKQIIAVGEDVFEGVEMPSAIIILEKCSSESKRDSSSVATALGLDSRIQKVEQKEFLKNDEYVFDIFGDRKAKSIMQKIERKSVKLRELVYNARGVEIGKKSNIVSASKGDVKFLIGSDIDRYQIKGVHYLKLGNKDVDYKDESLYKGEKILIRKTGLGINAVLDKDSHVIQVIYILKQKNKDYDLRYLLGILNSRLMNYYYFSKFGQKERKTFPHLTQGKVLQLPIKIVAQEPLINRVDKILSLNKRLNEIGDKKTDERQRIEEEIKKTDAEIDELVYQLYGITDEEKKIIEESLK